ncbi:hypothetical protein NDU88_010423 [Pleurodeles waltl]|uniref:Uncharacterized protein n=1 Tax=Pleurodeles waltl TaxID=8319 RepID=A0AAV7Q023_PLEWA|nr:hypothetical protein NDU88_010423 [Pleurodeles waltl]
MASRCLRHSLEAESRATASHVINEKQKASEDAPKLFKVAARPSGSVTLHKKMVLEVSARPGFDCRIGRTNRPSEFWRCLRTATGVDQVGPSSAEKTPQQHGSHYRN